MARCNKSFVCSLCVFFVTFVMIYSVADAVIEQDSDSNGIEINSSVLIRRLLKGSSSVSRFTNDDPQEDYDRTSQFPHASFSKHTSSFIVHYHTPTSCGQLTRDSVSGYPEDIIIKVTKSSNLILESPGVDIRYKVKVPVAKSLNHKRSPHHPPMHFPEKVDDCWKLVEEIVVYPIESVNEEDQPKLLVNLSQYNFGQSARECRGPKACRDRTMAEHKVFRCRTDYRLEMVKAVGLSKQKNEPVKMLIPNGCKCDLHDG